MYLTGKHCCVRYFGPTASDMPQWLRWGLHKRTKERRSWSLFAPFSQNNKQCFPTLRFLARSPLRLWYNCWSRTNKADDIRKIIDFFLPHYHFLAPKREVAYQHKRWALREAEVYEITVSGWWQWKVRKGFLLGAMQVCLYAFWNSDAYVLIQRQNQHHQTNHFSHCWTWTTWQFSESFFSVDIYMDGEFPPLISILKSFIFFLVIIISRCWVFKWLWC